MAFGAQNIFPEDFNKKALGVNIPFNGSAVFTSNYKTKDIIKNNLINYLLTNPGERIANPRFGAGIRAFIFEQIGNNTLEFLEQDLQSKINQNFNNLLLDNLEVSNSKDTPNTIFIKISYSIPNTNISDSLQLTFK